MNQLLRWLPLALLFFVPGCYVDPGTSYSGYSTGVYAPPPIAYQGYPTLVVIPDTYAYAAADIAVDLFFWNGYWWRPWENRWYRSRYHNRAWHYYSGTPGFYYDVDPRWREYYRSRNWQGNRWTYERLPSHKVQRNWKKWQNDRHWEKQGTWGVHNYKPRPPQQKQELRRQRHQEIQQRQPRMGEPRQPSVTQPGQGAPEIRQQRVRPPQAPSQQRQPQARQPRGDPREENDGLKTERGWRRGN